MKAQIKHSYQNTTSRKLKNYLKNSLCGKIIKKYKFLNEINKNILPSTRANKYNPKTRRGFIKKDVENFYILNSTIDPGKKAFVKVNGEKIQKMYMNASMIDLHAQFCSEKNYTVCYKTFTTYHPTLCKAPKVSERDTCACIIHQNFSFLITALHNNKILKENSIAKVVKNMVCEPRTEECLSKICKDCNTNKMMSLNLI